MWSPAWLRRFERVKILPKKTYDASATPTVGASRRTVRLADVDLAQLREAMKTSVERAAAEDPKKLRAEIARLQREMGAKPVAAPAAPKPRRIEIPVVSEKKLERVAGSIEKLAGQVELLQQTLAVWRALHATRLEAATAAAGAPRWRATKTPFDMRRAMDESTVQIVKPRALGPLGVHRLTPPSTNGHPREGGRLTKGERLMLTALAMHAPVRVPAPRAALLSGYSINSSTFRNILSQLRTQGFAAGDRSGLGITERGLDALGEFDPLPTGADLQDYWLNWVGRSSATGRVLAALLQAWPQEVGRDVLAERATQSPTSSTYRNALSTLRTLGLISGRGALAVSPHLGLGCQ